MSNTRRGARTLKTGGAEGPKVSRELVTSVLIAILYAIFMFGALWEGGLFSLVSSAIMFILMVLMAYTVDKGTHNGQQPFRSLIFVFAGMSAVSLAAQLLVFLGVMAAAGIYWAAALGASAAAVSIVSIGAIVYFEKDDLKRLYMVPGDYKAMALGAAGLAMCLIGAFIGAYYVFGGNAIGQAKLVGIAASVIVFGVLMGVMEEAWFRGLMLSRIIPLLGDSYGNIFQAAVFGIFEAAMFYIVTGMGAYVPAIFIIGAFTGFYWGRATLKAGSIVASALLHVGLYILLLLPLLVGRIV